ncbi:hypothetical protein RISK_005950 [Rhodopirellula islandica]|uniref:Uncharacterized protein n=1 Tax=Rhodopirellula islandica TaxID=595434 RepID=A0A0J1B5A6_RHOIS|nr:hypothetical protein RISK_005950 [Rhodopirellula islandica]
MRRSDRLVPRIEPTRRSPPAPLPTSFAIEIHSCAGPLWLLCRPSAFC